MLRFSRVLALVAAFAATPAIADYTITFDGGGKLTDYIDKYNAIRTGGGSVKIDGMCLSACTIVTILPPEKICVTPFASLGFHSATIQDEYSSQGTGIYWHMIPKPVRALVEVAGWDGASEHEDFVFLEFDELKTLYKECP
jgi:hypothetical protein